MENKGFIMIDRSILEDDMYFSEKFTRMQAYIDLCLLAAFKSRSFYIRGNKVELQPMQVAKSVRDLADRWQWSVNKVRGYLYELEKGGYIDTQKTSVNQIITIKKYIVVNTQNDTQINTQINTQTDTQNDTQTDTPIIKNNNVNNENKEIVIESVVVSNEQQTLPTPTKEKKRRSSVFVKPTLEECIAYANEKGFNWDASRFYNYYESNGWRVGRNPMKNWKAAMSSWNTKEPKYPQQSLFPSTSNNNNNNNNNGLIQNNYDTGTSGNAEYDSYLAGLRNAGVINENTERSYKQDYRLGKQSQANMQREREQRLANGETQIKDCPDLSELDIWMD